MQPSTAVALALIAFAPSALAQASRPAAHVTRIARPPTPAGETESLGVIATTGTVDIRPRVGAPHCARSGESLSRGDRISVGDNGFAVLALPNGVVLSLSPGARLTAFESPAGVRPSNTTLEAGSVRVSSPSAVTRSFALSTDSATVFLGHGDGVVQSLARRFTTRISTHSGVIRARYASNEFSVDAGLGVSIEAGRRSHSHELLAPPVWTAAPPTDAVTAGHPLDVTGTYARSRPQRVWRWRTEVARDEAFHEVIAMTRAGRNETRWSGRALAPGTYYVRVVALDVDLYESQPSAVARVTVRAPEIDRGATDGQGRLATVRIPVGLLCGLDGGVIHEVTEPMRLSPARDHVLRCATRADGSDAREVVIPAVVSGPMQHDVQVRVTNFGEGVVTVRLRDGEGYGIPYASIEVEGQGVHTHPLREGVERGVYRAPIFWRGANPPPLDLRFTVNGLLRFEERIERPENTFASLNQ